MAMAGMSRRVPATPSLLNRYRELKPRMTQTRILHEWVKPEWVKEAPIEWVDRLRQVSPIVEKTSHLWFRWFADHELWVTYECTPAHLLSAERVEQLSEHWSVLPKDRQQGRKSCVSEYQHYMFRTHRVEARLHWFLQGGHGGTPAKFTDREVKILEAIGESGDVIPLGTLPYAPFDERAVRAIVARDRLLKLGGDLEELLKTNRPDRLEAEDDETERQFRKAFVGWWMEEMKPMSDFMKWYLGQSESDHMLPRATRQEANAVTQWRDQYIDTGIMPSSTGSASSQKIAVPVLTTI